MARRFFYVENTPRDEFTAAVYAGRRAWQLLYAASVSLGYESTAQAAQDGRWAEVISEAVEAEEALYV